MKKLLTFYPVLFGVYFVLALYAHNIERTPLHSIYAPLLATIGICVALLVLLRVILKDREKAGLAASFTIVVLFTYGHLASIVAVSGWVVFAGWLALLLLSVFRLKGKAKIHTLVSFSSIMVAVLILIPAITIINYALIPKQYPEFEARTGKCDTAPPDIYYIIVDKYAGFETLREYFDYENDEFANFLVDKGFYIVQGGFANYATTGHSLASSLNMDYVYPGTRAQLSYLMQNYAVWRYLEPMDYKYVHVGCRNFDTESNEYADVNYVRKDGLFATEFSCVLYESTLLYALIDTPIEELNSRMICWKDVQYQFEVLSEIPGMSEPTFTFAHILCPHHPFVFERDGSFKVMGTYPEDEDWNERYLDQLICLNSMLERLIDRILEDSNETPIIIIQSDEGARTKEVLGGARTTILWTRFEILSAYHLPNGNDVLYPTITPVNSFRVIFNEYFGGDFALLPDKNYCVNFSSPYEYTDITELLKERK